MYVSACRIYACCYLKSSKSTFEQHINNAIPSDTVPAIRGPSLVSRLALASSGGARMPVEFVGFAHSPFEATSLTQWSGVRLAPRRSPIAPSVSHALWRGLPSSCKREASFVRLCGGVNPRCVHPPGHDRRVHADPVPRLRGDARP